MPSVRFFLSFGSLITEGRVDKRQNQQKGENPPELCLRGEPPVPNAVQMLLTCIMGDEIETIGLFRQLKAGISPECVQRLQQQELGPVGTVFVA